MQAATTYPEIVGAVLVRARKQAGRTQAELTAAVGVNQPTLSKIERGVSGASLDQLRRYAEAVGLTAGEVLGQADRVAKHAEAQGVQVVAEHEARAVGVALIGARALHALLEGVFGHG
jgi:transcriptional regulator with XRE-family HTH domain